MKNFETEESVPFYKKLKEMIVEDIESGKLKQGDKLPSERDLAERHKISRMTARHALSLLEREGFVERTVGAGTFVSNKKIRMDFTFNSFSKAMLDIGMKPTTQTLDMKMVPATSSVAKALNLSGDEMLFSLKRLRLADGIPVAIELSQIPYRYCQGIEKYMNENVSLYQILEDIYSIQLHKASQYTRIAISDEMESRLLKIQNESACILLETVAYDTEGRSIEFSQSVTRGDIVSFYTELSL
ncbi:GntR family transcriptional regulator [Fontibacillus phaseoli]|uniref:GntR family transcriptional regulator n=1 Tax=Fontibacillus phaseoli TaxID=1416533 RepID=A0A369BEL0_9BACL|nr:GntR family transcriptional regulator [Fontibacillus phaseoli]RCX18114.1 GntR family transcriptional regulator [Fontibacillus phaseoli]